MTTLIDKHRAEIQALFPRRAVVLSLLAGIVLVVSTVPYAALASWAVAWVAILASVVVLPAADRLAALDGDAR